MVISVASGQFGPLSGGIRYIVLGARIGVSSERTCDMRKLYNASLDLIGRNLSSATSGKTAVIDDNGSYTYLELSDRVHRCANALRVIGIRPGDRVLLCLPDSIDFVVCFLGAVAAGIIPVILHPMTPMDRSATILAETRSAAIIISAPRHDLWLEVANSRGWRGRIVVSGLTGTTTANLTELLRNADPTPRYADTQSDDECFWLYSSGSSGTPKAVLHSHGSLIKTAELYAVNTLQMNGSDVIFSAAKLSFAYGLGNSLSFPLAIGGTSILSSGKATNESLKAVIERYRPTVFFAVPSLFHSILLSLPSYRWTTHGMRFSVSAGEMLPESVGRMWRDRIGIDILDGIGSTELLHIYLSNRPGRVNYGTTGIPVKGYNVELRDEDGNAIGPDQIGELFVRGPSTATDYPGSTEVFKRLFRDGWFRSGDRFTRDATGVYTYCGRTDEMLKINAQWVSPREIEEQLFTYPAVLDAALVGYRDDVGLMRSRAIVVLKPGITPDEGVAQSLLQFLRQRLSAHKVPTQIEFIDELPKTLTGKTNRYLLSVDRTHRTRR